MLFLVVQFSALAGAVLMAKPTDTWGPKVVVIASLCLWCGVVLAAYLVQTQTQYWAIAIVAGLGLGSVQAASRAFFARFIPPGEETQYFGLYAMVGKSAAIMGPVVFLASDASAMVSCLICSAVSGPPSFRWRCFLSSAWCWLQG